MIATNFATRLGLTMGNKKEKLPYMPARLVSRNNDLSKRWYVEFYVWHAEKEKLQRKQVFLPSIYKTLKERKDYATRRIKEINELLLDGHHIKAQLSRSADVLKETKQEKAYYTFQSAITYAVEIKQTGSRTRTVQVYSSFLNVFTGWLRASSYADLPIADVRTLHVYRFLDYLKTERKVGNRMRNNYRDFIRTMFNVLISREIITKNPCAGIAKLPTETGRNIAFTPVEKAQIEAYLLAHDVRLFYFTRFIFYAFIRPLELLQLQIRHVDVQTGKIMIPAHISKNRKQQVVAILPPLVETINSLQLGSYPPNYYLFGKDLQPSLKAMLRNRVSERHKRALDALQLNNAWITLYSWKHTGVIAAYQAGLGIKSLQRHLRHHSLEVTDIYLKSMGLSEDKELLEKSW